MLIYSIFFALILISILLSFRAKLIVQNLLRILIRNFGKQQALLRFLILIRKLITIFQYSIEEKRLNNNNNNNKTSLSIVVVKNLNKNLIINNNLNKVSGGALSW